MNLYNIIKFILIQRDVFVLMEKLSKEELLRKSKIPEINAIKMHKFYKGKIP